MSGAREVSVNNEQPDSQKKSLQQTKQLLFWGMLLFFFGLIQGGLIQAVVNPRMALAAHLTAVQTGMALMIFGLLWRYVQLKSGQLKVTLVTSIASMYLIWIALTYASLVGVGGATPIAGAGFAGSAFQETLFEVVIALGSLFGLVSGLLLVIGLGRTAFAAERSQA